MSTNQLRDTPGRLLLGWAVLLSALVILAWRIHLHPVDYEWTEYPTALGDRALYLGLGPEDDRYKPNLKFAGQEKGLFRRVEDTVEMDDAVMFKIAKESSGRWFVYKPVTAGRDAEPPVYLKAGDGRYVEFGAKKFYKPYAPK
ncbi:MAG: hypothetical protein RIS79_2464 [Verrucomicrobiota bacterium]|jgi:hypothetical protein